MKSACTNLITFSTVKAWHTIRKLEGTSRFTSVFTPICDNPDFTLGLMDSNFQIWGKERNIYFIQTTGGSTIMSFNLLQKKYDIQKQDFFGYLQVRDCITKDTRILQWQDISHLERQLFLQKYGSSISVFYNILKGYNITNTSSLKGLWERDLNVKITDDGWNDTWKSCKNTEYL